MNRENHLGTYPTARTANTALYWSNNGSGQGHRFTILPWHADSSVPCRASILREFPAWKPRNKTRYRHQSRSIATAQLPSDPMIMISRIVPLTTQAQLLRNIDIAISADLASLDEVLEVALRVLLPRRPAKRTSDLRSTTTGFPSIEARFVQVVATSGFAPDDLLVALLQIAAADRTVVFDGFALAVFVALVGFFDRQRTGVLEDLAQFRGQECELITQMRWCFEDCVQNIDDVLALRIAFGEIWTGAGGYVLDADLVDISCAPCKVDDFHWAVWCTVGTVVVGRAVTVQSKEALVCGSVVVCCHAKRCLCTVSVIVRSVMW